MHDLNKAVIDDFKRMKGTKRRSGLAPVERYVYVFLKFLSNVKNLINYLLEWRKGGRE